MGYVSNMPPDESGVGYFIWGVDHASYGPVELPTLVNWIQDERVTADTWIFVERCDSWEKAASVPELQMFFHGSHAAMPGEAISTGTIFISGASGELSSGALRHIKILSCLSDEQLERFVQFMQVETVPAGSHLARQGERSHAMHLLIEGELRVRTLMDGRETTVGALNAGEFFGEVSLFDQGPRCNDIIATTECSLLTISAADLERLAYEAPDVTAPFLLAVGKCLASRIRTDNKRYRDSVSFVHPAGR
jgi:CRP/FNR family cyclic AMP-dependent transcriptional regulator